MISPGKHPDVRATRFRRGDLVTVRSLEEILATLDADGKLEGLPFMSEMARYCGRTFRVDRRAERVCVEGADGPRRMEHTVFLEGLRCDGSAHQGCQRGCLTFWKEAWLKPASRKPADPGLPSGDLAIEDPRLASVQDGRFYCQSTELSGATSQLPPGDFGYYLKDLWRGESSLGRVLHVFCLKLANFIWRRIYRREYYCRPAGSQRKTAHEELNLQPGELVEVKSLEEIRATLDPQGRNRGLTFEAEMRQYCGRRFRVYGPVRTIIAETSGKMLKLHNTVILDGLTCRGICIKNCPRANYFYWREVWLKRVEPQPSVTDEDSCTAELVQIG